MNFYVSPTGDDACGGTRPDPAAAGGEGPFRTLERARGAVRAHRAARPAAPVTVWLRGGTYTLQGPLILGPADGGAPGAPVTYAAYPGERPVVSGGRRITGWRPVHIAGRPGWAAEVPEARNGAWAFRQLWVNGERRSRPRLPAAGFHRIASLPDVTSETPWTEGQSRFAFAPGDLSASWHRLQDVEIVALHYWVDSHLPLRAVDEDAALATCGKRSIFRLTDDYRPRGARYYVDNVLEALDRPGQWYLDRGAGVLSYLPLPGEDPEAALVIAPRLPQLLRLEGAEPDGPAVAHLVFQGITFAHTEWSLAADGPAGSAQAAADVPAAIALRGARACAFQGCFVEHCGTYALEVGPGCADIRLERCRLADLGAGGVQVRAGSVRTAVAGCEITRCGRLFHAGVGVLIFDSGHNQVVGNHIHGLYYTGVSVGWVWGYGESHAVDNLVASNHIHDIGQGMLNDMGGIYTLGVSPGTAIRDNRIHDVRSDGYGGWGIYLDEGSTGIVVEGNLVYRTKTGGLHQHYGRDNVVRNNVFALAAEGQVQRTRIEEHRSFRFTRNIVYGQGPLLHGAWREPAAAFDHNLYCDPSGAPLDFGDGRTLAQWRALGMDGHASMADPRFRDPARGDFSLGPDSPAQALGFRPLTVPAAEEGDGDAAR